MFWPRLTPVLTGYTSADVSRRSCGPARSLYPHSLAPVLYPTFYTQRVTPGFCALDGERLPFPSILGPWQRLDPFVQAGQNGEAREGCSHRRVV